MGRVKPRLYNHKNRIINRQSAPIKAIYPGMVCQFDYNKKKTIDKHPLVLVLWNDYRGYKIHGINLNYLSEYDIKVMFLKVMTGAQTYNKAGHALYEQDEKNEGESEYDDTLPYRNLLKKPFTRLNLPVFREIQEVGTAQKTTSKSEAERQMKMLYRKVLKTFNRQKQVYRTYINKKVSGMKAINYQIDALVDENKL